MTIFNKATFQLPSSSHNFHLSSRFPKYYSPPNLLLLPLVWRRRLNTGGGKRPPPPTRKTESTGSLKESPFSQKLIINLDKIHVLPSPESRRRRSKVGTLNSTLKKLESGAADNEDETVQKVTTPSQFKVMFRQLKASICWPNLTEPYIVVSVLDAATSDQVARQWISGLKEHILDLKSANHFQVHQFCLTPTSSHSHTNNNGNSNDGEEETDDDHLRSPGALEEYVFNNDIHAKGSGEEEAENVVYLLDNFPVAALMQPLKRRDSFVRECQSLLLTLQKSKKNVLIQINLSFLDLDTWLQVFPVEAGEAPCFSLFKLAKNSLGLTNLLKEKEIDPVNWKALYNPRLQALDPNDKTRIRSLLELHLRCKSPKAWPQGCYLPSPELIQLYSSRFKLSDISSSLGALEANKNFFGRYEKTKPEENILYEEGGLARFLSQKEKVQRYFGEIFQSRNGSMVDSFSLIKRILHLNQLCREPVIVRLLPTPLGDRGRHVLYWIWTASSRGDGIEMLFLDISKIPLSLADDADSDLLDATLKLQESEESEEEEYSTRSLFNSIVQEWWQRIEEIGSYHSESNAPLISRDGMTRLMICSGKASPNRLLIEYLSSVKSNFRSN